MKKHLFIYAIFILGFIGYNIFFRADDSKTNTGINILWASLIFGYIGYMAFVLLRKLKK